MMGFGMGFNGIWMIMFWIIVIGGGVWILASLFPRANSYPPANPGNDALEVLKERYARGEISKEEYQTIRHELEN